MAAPNIDMIAASLRNCSLGGRRASSPAPASFRMMGRDLMSEGGANGATAAAVAADTTLELNSDVALPYHWEQCLDLKTGRIYYINWSTGAKSMEDPRKFSCLAESCCSDEDGDEADDENDGGASGDEEADDSSEENGGSAAADDSDGQYGNCSSVFSSSSSASSRDTIERGCTGRGRAAGGADSVLVAAGCRVCMMYVMIPKRTEECPRCGGHVLHFTRSGGK